jgi:hypothetical protein
MEKKSGGFLNFLLLDEKEKKLRFLFVIFLFSMADSAVDRDHVRRAYRLALLSKRCGTQKKEQYCTTLTARAQVLLPAAQEQLRVMEKEKYASTVLSLLKRVTVTCSEMKRSMFSKRGRDRIYSKSKYNPQYAWHIAITREVMNRIGAGFFPSASSSCERIELFSMPVVLSNFKEDLLNTRENWSWLNDLLCVVYTAFAHAQKAEPSSAEEGEAAANQFDYMNYMDKMGAFLGRELEASSFIPCFELLERRNHLLSLQENKDEPAADRIRSEYDYLYAHHSQYIAILGAIAPYDDDSSDSSDSSASSDSSNISDGEGEEGEEGEEEAKDSNGI